MMDDTVLVERSGDVLVIRLNRPRNHNAWTGAMRDDIAAALADADRRADIRAIVLTGTGEKAFCAGQDLAETERFLGAASVGLWLGNLRRFYDAIRAATKPLVGALNGLAAGSGFQVAMMMDVVVAHPGVRMGQPEVNSGIPSIFGPWLMAQSLGRARTAELAVTGRMMAAEECHRLGLIHHLVAPEAVLGTALSIARDLAARPPTAMRLTKSFLRRANEAEYERAWEWAAEGQGAAFETGEPQAVMRAFFEERRRRKARRGS
jgi:enoyl-CoA hydratase/carnithine racemase